MDFLKLTSDKLDPTVISDLVVHESCGAVAMFAGTTRDNFDGKQVVTLEYEAYDEMAKKEMASICFEIRQRWPEVKNIAMYHRLGLVPVKEASVVIAISSPHRSASLEALPFALDQLKKSVPVWKKEYYKEQADQEVILQSGKKKRKKLDFDLCPVVDELQIHESLVQITVSEDEIQRRIEAFIEQKRNEINRNNLRDFVQDGSEELCARVSSNVYRIKDSKGHLRIKRIKNETGPMSPVKNDNLKLTEEHTKTESSFGSINERLENVETFLKLESVSIPKDIFLRLKLLEDQVEHLKTVSPEYTHYLSKNRQPGPNKKKIVYSIDDLDKIIAEMEAKAS